MELKKLCRIELYRFFHSMEIVKYFVLVPVVLFSMCYINIFSVRNDISTAAVWSSVLVIYMYMIAAMGVLIAIYIGREFHYKTIHYELVKGYKIGKIAVSKTVTCGIIVPVIDTICMSVYLVLVSDSFSKELLFRIVLLLIVHIHICSSSALYVMLCRNGVLGGVVVFIRFYIGEFLGQLLVAHLESKTIAHYFQKMQTFHQWYELIHIEEPVTGMSILWIVGMALVEYGILLLLLNIIRKRVDIR